LTPQRSEFFANDVIFLGDMPRVSLSDRFCEMTKEYVSVFGGGLVVITGPRFGLNELADTPLADMLPVIIDREARVDDQREYLPSLSPHSLRYPFMQLGDNDAENAKAWSNMGRLPWYQPVAGLHEQAYSLMDHPTDYCRDGRTPQPLIAIRQYGNGEVVYLAQNEMWRLRRKYGELYYRKFWSQLIYRLGMSHALGSEKRFVARSDRRMTATSLRWTRRRSKARPWKRPGTPRVPTASKRLRGALRFRCCGAACLRPACRCIRRGSTGFRSRIR